MKLIVRRAKQNDGATNPNILAVWSFNHYLDMGKTEEEITKAVESNSDAYSIVEVPDELSEIFDFILGDRKYVGTATIRSLKQRIEDVIDNCEEIQTEVQGFVDCYESLNRDLEKFVKDLKEDN